MNASSSMLTNTSLQRPTLLWISLINLHTQTFTLPADDKFYFSTRLCCGWIFFFNCRLPQHQCTPSQNIKLLHSPLSPSGKPERPLSIDSGILSGADTQNDCVRSAAPAAQNQHPPAYKPSNHLLQRFSIRLRNKGENGAVAAMARHLGGGRQFDGWCRRYRKPDVGVSSIVLAFPD